MYANKKYRSNVGRPVCLFKMMALDESREGSNYMHGGIKELSYNSSVPWPDFVPFTLANSYRSKLSVSSTLLLFRSY